MSDDDRIAKLEEEMKWLKAKQQDNDDDEAVKYRSDQYRFSRIDGQMGSQEIHGNLKGLNNDDHPHYLNSTRHDVSTRHGDDVIGNRTIDDTSAPTGNEGKLTNLFSWLGYMIKAITGEISWRTIPTTTLKTAGTHISAANPHSGSEPSFTKKTAFNKDFGTAEGTVCEGNDSRLSDSRTPNEHGNEAHSNSLVGEDGVIAALAEKTTPDNNDVMGIEDSAASYALKKISWANIKATLAESGIGSGASLPTPSPIYRGKIFTVLGGSGIPDISYICVKKADGDYVWRNLLSAIYNS